jgi:hypothetical protein
MFGMAWLLTVGKVLKYGIGRLRVNTACDIERGAHFKALKHAGHDFDAMTKSKI